MRIGFTGTRDGCTDAQYRLLSSEVEYLRDQGAYAGHHGDCVGGDADFHEICRTLGGLWLVVHPPKLDRLRAYKPGNEIRLVKPYLPRNRDIVDETDILVACPNDGPPRPNSGTWYTIDFAVKRRKPVVIIHADATIQRLNSDDGI